MLGLGPSDLWWVAASAFVAAFAGWFAVKTRLGMTWLLRKTRQGFLDWFGDAINTHVEPKLEDLRAYTLASAAETQENTRRAANDLKIEQQAAVHAEVAPIVERLDSHVTNDDRVMAAAGEALVKGQNQLSEQIERHHRESMDTIHRHVLADAEAFARIEEQLKEIP